ncbi:MAG: DUF4956 domain-containing protein [Clostridiales bacterium]|nr:DUF4956 domain-containing protein [Clostridiales bacterium]
MFDSIISSSLTPTIFAVCLISALLLGSIVALIYMFRSQYTRSFAQTLALLPAMVSVVIMMVSGNLGAGVAVAGTFSLVRFRSAPGTAREIGAIFLAMAIGLACGMGYIGFAVLFTLIICLVMIVYNAIGFGTRKEPVQERRLSILVPEDLEYNGMFDDLFDRFTSEAHLRQVKTTNLGSLNRLTYDITLQKPGTEKSFIDELRTRNGNLEISLSLRPQSDENL